MTESQLIIFNAIANSTGLGYRLHEDKKWGTLRISGIEMKILGKDYDHVRRIMELSEERYSDELFKFYKDQVIYNRNSDGSINHLSDHRIISACYLDWLEAKTGNPRPKYKHVARLALVANRIVTTAKVSTDDIIGNTSILDWMDQFKMEPEILSKLKILNTKKR